MALQFFAKLNLPLLEGPFTGPSSTRNACFNWNGSAVLLLGNGIDGSVNLFICGVTHNFKVLKAVLSSA